MAAKKLLLLSLLFSITLKLLSQEPTLSQTQQWLKTTIETYCTNPIIRTYYKVSFPDSTRMKIEEYLDPEYKEFSSLTLIDFTGLAIDETFIKIKKNGFWLHLRGKVKYSTDFDIPNVATIPIDLGGSAALYFSTQNPSNLSEKIMKALKHYKKLVTGDVGDLF